MAVRGSLPIVVMDAATVIFALTKMLNENGQTEKRAVWVEGLEGEVEKQPNGCFQRASRRYPYIG